MIEELKKQLPNIPEEVIVNWLLPFAEVEGMPSPSHEWDIRKTGEVLVFWNDADWQKVKLDITKLNYSKSHHRTINSLLAGYTKGERNPYSDHMGENGKSRFKRCLLYILENGVFPVAPILVMTHKNEYQVIDGNHRFTAYKAAVLAYLEPKAVSEEIMKELEVNIKKPCDIQEVWICKPNWDNSPTIQTQKYLLKNGIDIDNF